MNFHLVVIATRTIKPLEINLRKEMQDLYSENYINIVEKK